MSQEIVDETFQEVWTVLLRRLGSLQHEQALPQWLITTARRIALRAAQRARRLDARRSEELPDQAHYGNGDLRGGDRGDHFVERVERSHQVADALDRLDPGCRELLVALTRSDETSYAQISRQLGMPIGSIGPKRARCLERLLQFLPPALRAEYRLPGSASEDGAGGSRTSR
jgi:RNA polymerase sigma factor (sigma-70 family)